MSDKKLSVFRSWVLRICTECGGVDGDGIGSGCSRCSMGGAPAEEVEVIPLDRVRDVVEKFEKLADQAEEVERRIRGQAEGSDEEASYLAAAELEMGRSVAYGFAAEYLHEKFPDSTKETK